MGEVMLCVGEVMLCVGEVMLWVVVVTLGKTAADDNTASVLGGFCASGGTTAVLTGLWPGEDKGVFNDKL